MTDKTSENQTCNDNNCANPQEIYHVMSHVMEHVRNCPKMKKKTRLSLLGPHEICTRNVHQTRLFHHLVHVRFPFILCEHTPTVHTPHNTHAALHTHTPQQTDTHNQTHTVRQTQTNKTHKCFRGETENQVSFFSVVSHEMCTVNGNRACFPP